MNTMALTEDAN